MTRPPKRTAKSGAKRAKPQQRKVRTEAQRVLGAKKPPAARGAPATPRKTAQALTRREQHAAESLLVRYDPYTLLTPNQMTFLTFYVTTCPTITSAARAADINRRTHYWWQANDANYADAFDIAEELQRDTLYEEAWRRAMTGEKPSDYLLAKLLEGRDARFGRQPGGPGSTRNDNAEEAQASVLGVVKRATERERARGEQGVEVVEGEVVGTE